MKNFLPAILLLLGSIGYQPAPYVSLVLSNNEELIGVRLYDLAGDSISVDEGRWIHLQHIRQLVYHAPGTEISVSTNSGSEILLTDYTVLEDGSLEGEGFADADHEIPFSGRIQRNEIIDIQNHVSVSYFLPSLFGGLAGCTAGLLIVGEPRINNLLRGGASRACSDVNRSLVSCNVGLLVGGLAGIGIAHAISSDPYSYDFFGVPIGERRAILRSIFNE